MLFEIVSLINLSNKERTLYSYSMHLTVYKDENAFQQPKAITALLWQWPERWPRYKGGQASPTLTSSREGGSLNVLGQVVRKSFKQESSVLALPYEC